MGAAAGGLWWIVTFLAGVVGTGMVIYGIRQKEPAPLAFGVAISLVPLVLGAGIFSAALSIGLVVVFMAGRKYF